MRSMKSRPNASKIRADTIVLGAGPAGLGAALALGDSAVVLESQDNVGGLCRSLMLDGAVFDLGGHSFTTPHPAIRRLVFDALEMEEQKRDAWCWLNGEWVRYPFQQHFSELADPDSRHACQIGLEAAGGWRDAANFDEYLDHRFGRGITELFMRPYNRKLWGADLTRLDTDWIAERVAAPPGIAESCMSKNGRRSTAFKRSCNRLSSQRRIWRDLPSASAKGSRSSAWPVRHKYRPTNLNTTNCEWRNSVLAPPHFDTSSARVVAADPKRPCCNKLRVSTLEALPITLVMFVLNGRHETLRQRIYCPDENISGHKIVLNHNSSRWLRALPRHSVQVELSEFSPFSSSTNVTALVCAVIAGLLRMAVIPSPDYVRCTKVLRIPSWIPGSNTFARQHCSARTTLA